MIRKWPELDSSTALPFRVVDLLPMKPIGACNQQNIHIATLNIIWSLTVTKIIHSSMLRINFTILRSYKRRSKEWWWDSKACICIILNIFKITAYKFHPSPPWLLYQHYNINTHCFHPTVSIKIKRKSLSFTPPNAKKVFYIITFWMSRIFSKERHLCFLNWSRWEGRVKKQ